MVSTLCDIMESVVNFFSNLIGFIGLDMLFFISIAVELALVAFFFIKSTFSYESKLNRSLERVNYWLFEKKVVTEENIKDLNALFKFRTPKRVCYYWQQYILFREGTPSSYLSTDNLVDKPMKTSSYASNISNLTISTLIWAAIVAMFNFVGYAYGSSMTGRNLVTVIFVPVVILLVGFAVIAYMRARKNSMLNSLYQSVQLFGRFMDNACVDLPTYIDYQLLFTPQEIQNGQPVLREFLDYKARREKEEFNRAKEEEFIHEEYDFSATGVDGSLVLDRAMRESETFLKQKEKILLKISQLEAELESRRKNFDNVQKDYQTKIQASKENVERLRQMQEETTNRIESNYYRKQQTQEIGKQEQYEAEFEQQRAKYLLERKECEEEIKKLNKELDKDKTNCENALLSEYQTFFNKFCHSAELVLTKAFSEKIDALQAENERDKKRITDLEIKLKSVPQGVLDADEVVAQEGHYDEEGNYVYPNGTFYDKDGNFHDENGDVYSQDGQLIEKRGEKKKGKKVVNFDNFDSFDFMTDVSQKGDVYGVAENVINNIDEGESVEVVNSADKSDFLEGREVEEPKEEKKEEKPAEEKVEKAPVELDDFILPEKKEEPKQEEPVKEEPAHEEKEEEQKKPKKKVGRPKKTTTTTSTTPKRKVGRPRKIVKDVPTQKRSRGRPKKQEIDEINKRLSEEEARISEMRAMLNKDLESAMNEIDSANVDANKAKRDKLIKEIDRLQREAQQVIEKHESENKIAEINSRLEDLLEEVKKLN